ncbi:MAG: SRPBCC family protein [Pseudomonadota bacterium]
MTTITREVRINAPKEKVWDILADFGNIYLFNPNVPTSYLTSDQKRGVGTTRHCDVAGPFDGASIEERIISWNEGESMEIEIYEGKKSPPFKKAIASLRVSEDRGETVVTGTLAYTLKMGPLGYMMDKFMVASQFNKAWTGVLAGLKHYAETGQPIEDPKVVDFTPVAVVA